jgi:hypothetical protein
MIFLDSAKKDSEKITEPLDFEFAFKQTVPVSTTCQRHNYQSQMICIGNRLSKPHLPSITVFFVSI